MKKIPLLLFAFGLLILPGRVLPDDASLKKSVVKIFTVTNRPNYYKPWERGYQYNTSGSGCVLPGNLVLTNAHVVSDAVFLQVMKAGDTRKFTAKVEYVDHDREVAVLKVEDGDFFKGTVPVQYGDLPVQRDKVAVYGFPIGGDELSITEGVVSRIEVQIYTHSQRHFLAIQTDAAINAGNSGGPAFKGGKMVGVAFQAYGKAENTGYIVPMEIIQKSLQDWKEGVLDGPPSLGIYWQKMESPSLKAYYRMKPSHSGVLVTKILYGSPAEGKLEVEDVVLSVGGVAIADNGTVKFRKDERLNFSHVISQYQSGKDIPLEILRDGKVRKVSLRMDPFGHLVPGPQYDVRPSYFVAAGLVFMPLTYDYLALWKNNSAPTELMNYYENGMASDDRKQVVFINEVLPHEVNVGYHHLKQAVVVKVNGKPISELKDVAEAFRKPQGDYHVVELDHPTGGGDNFGNWVILKAEGFEKAGEEILTSFGVPQDRSDDLDGTAVNHKDTKDGKD